MRRMLIPHPSPYQNGTLLVKYQLGKTPPLQNKRIPYILPPYFLEKENMNTLTPRLLAKQQGLTKYVGEPCIHGHSGERWVHNHSCIQCKYDYKKKNRTYGKVGRPRKVDVFVGPLKPKRKFFHPKTDVEHWIKRSRCKGRKQGNTRKELSVDYYRTLISTHCPLLGVELIYKKFEGHRTPDNYATLDKIDPKLGYVEGNVQIVSFRANTLKNSATLKELQTIVANWEKMCRI